LKSHPGCCFCGNAKASSRDHVPASEFISSMQVPTIENNNFVVVRKQFIFSIDDVEEYIFICFKSIKLPFIVV